MMMILPWLKGVTPPTGACLSLDIMPYRRGVNETWGRGLGTDETWGRGLRTDEEKIEMVYMFCDAIV